MQQRKKRDHNRYKEKQCPICGKLHRRFRLHCSQSCGNKSRKFKEETKQRISNSLRKHYSSPEGIAVRQKIANKNRGIPRIKQEDIDISLPELYDPEFDF